MEQTFFALGGFTGGLAVTLGAFGTHALRGRLSAESLQTFETGVRYQMYHALAMLAIALALARWPASSLLGLSGWLFFTGTILFSGSLFLLVLSGNVKFGMVTPFGGVALILGWVCLGAAVGGG